MPITRKPKPASENGAPPVDVEALIAKGGSVGSGSVGITSATGGADARAQAQGSADSDARREVAFTLRVPAPLLQSLDQHLNEQPFKTPRQRWILEAIVQKLERDAGEDA